MDLSSLRERPFENALNVTELNNFIKNLIDSNRTLSAVSVVGEISNFTDHRSGHLYFSLKDSDSQIKAVMFRSARSRLKFMPEDGMKVTVHGTVSVYSQTGTVQLYVNTMSPDGVGALYKAYEQMKEKLSAEGLFDEAYKKPLPEYPARVGVITSPTGAAVRDIINVTGRRYPLAQIYLYPSLVQGAGAEENLIRALDYLDNSGLVDVIIIGRGGGSIEDLWAFNSEMLARRIFAARVPVVSAVGHETDFTICDFVADLRAPTPSAAAELSVPDVREIAIGIDDMFAKIESALLRIAERKRDRLERIAERPVLNNSEYLVSAYKDKISEQYDRVVRNINDKMFLLGAKLKEEIGKANAMSPLAVLSRGYSVAENENGVIKSAKDISVGAQIKLRFTDGYATAEVTSVNKKRKNSTKEKSE